MDTRHAITKAARTLARGSLRRNQNTGWPGIGHSALRLIIFQVIALLGLVFLPACQVPGASAMSGNWTFTINSSTSPITLATANLKQNGSQITGQLTLVQNNESCGNTASLTGSLQGNNLKFEIALGTSQLILTGTANQTFTYASGSYTTGGGGTCFPAGDFGSWSAFFG